MKNFWDGFEKIAISSKLLRKAEQMAEEKINTAPRELFFKNYKKWNRQRELFADKATKKQIQGK